MTPTATSTRRLPPEAGELLWSDEFDGPSIDARKWRYENSPPNNDEQQDYVTDERTAAVHDGALVLTALRDDESGAILSARLSTLTKFSFTYGVVTARVKLPWVRGFWPAFWMLGTDISKVGWPACGEIDIIEVFGHRRGRAACSTVHNQLHSWGTRDPLDGACAPLEEPPAWHEWTLVWTPSKVAFHFDGDPTPLWQYERAPGATDAGFPYTRPQYLVANLAVGGNGPSEPIDEAALLSPGTRLEIDYVRVYALAAGDAATHGTLAAVAPPKPADGHRFDGPAVVLAILFVAPAILALIARAARRLSPGACGGGARTRRRTALAEQLLPPAELEATVPQAV